MTKVISFISQKGGVGKSTLARALAVELANRNFSVKLVDLDYQQKTIFDWFQIRSAQKLPTNFSVELCQHASQAIIPNYSLDFIIIDGPARSSQGTLFLAQNSDLIIQPTSASRDDLVPALREFNSLVKANIFKSKLYFFLNHVSNSAEETTTREFIQQNGYLVFTGFLPERASYRQAHNEGKTIHEVNFTSLRERSSLLINSIITKLTKET